MTEENLKQETDYFGRMQRLSDDENKEWFRCDEGRHIVTFKSEGTPFDQEWEGETIHKLRFDIEVNRKPYSLSVTEAKSKNSFYGQLMLVATKVEPTNKLEGKTINLIVTGERKKKRYTVIEAAGLGKEEKIEEVQM